MNYKILLIEDNIVMAENISSILELARYQVIHAPNGKIGVNLAQQTTPDLILCDIIMPELDGYGVFHKLNNSQETAKIPFVFLTAKADKGDFRTGMNLGADDYITKPFDAIDLLKVIEMRLKKNEWKKSRSELQHLKDLENMLLGNDYQSVHQKVADALLKINATSPQSSPNSVISISIRDISHLVSTPSESLKRTLADFRDEGLIQISGEGLKITNLLKLKKIVNL